MRWRFVGLNKNVFALRIMDFAGLAVSAKRGNVLIKKFPILCGNSSPPPKSPQKVGSENSLK